MLEQPAAVVESTLPCMRQCLSMLRRKSFSQDMLLHDGLGCWGAHVGPPWDKAKKSYTLLVPCGAERSKVQPGLLRAWSAAQCMSGAGGVDSIGADRTDDEGV